MTKAEVQSKVAAFGTSIKAPSKQIGIALVLLLVVAIAFYAIPRVDPRSGIDGWGDVWAALVVCLKASFASVVAGLITRNHFAHLTDVREQELMAQAVKGSWQAFWLVQHDTGRFLFIWVAIFWATV